MQPYLKYIALTVLLRGKKIEANYHFKTRLIFQSSTFRRLFSPSKSPMYFSIFLLAFAIAYVTLALSTSLRSFLSGFSLLAASK